MAKKKKRPPRKKSAARPTTAELQRQLASVSAVLHAALELASVSTALHAALGELDDIKNTVRIILATVQPLSRPPIWKRNEVSCETKDVSQG